MKRESLLLGLAALVLAMTFVGCDNGLSNPDSITNTENAESISGPANLAARAYPGVNLITWDVHKDAASYYVYRKDMVTSDTTLLTQRGLTPDKTRHIDAVSTPGSLIDGREYTYTVIATSGKSPVQRSLDKDSIIHDGASSVKVTAKVPERGTAVKVPEEADISIEPKVIDGADFFIVTWTDKEDSFNKYKVSYHYGNKEPIDLYNLTSDTAADEEDEVSDYLTRQKYVSLPAIGGDLTFRVDGFFYTAQNSYYSDAYVLKPFKAEALTTLPAVENFSVTREGSNVRLTWKDVKGATAYAIYKAELDGISNTGTIVGAWTAVNTGSTQTQGADEPVNDKWSALEKDVPADKNYRYLIIAKAGTVRSKAPITADLSDPQVSVNQFTAAAFWSVNNVPSVAVSWSTQDNATYTLARAEAVQVGTDNQNPANPVLVAIEDYTPLALSSPTSSSFVDATAKKRHSYIYKLSATLDGITEDFTTNLTAEPYSNKVSAASLTVTASTQTVNAITVTFSAGTATLNSDLTAEIWRQETNDSGKLIGSATKLSDDLTVGASYEDTGVTVGKYYMYKLVLKSDQNPAMAETTTLYGGQNPNEGVAPSTAGASFTNGIFSGLNQVNSGTNTVFVYKANSGNPNTYPLLSGAPLYKMSRSAASTAALSAAKFSGLTQVDTIKYNTSSTALPGTYANVNQYDSYFSVSAPATTPANTYAEDIYFVLDGNGLPYNMTYNNGAFSTSDNSGNITVVQITRTSNQPPSASWTNVQPADIQWP